MLYMFPRKSIYKRARHVKENFDIRRTIKSRSRVATYGILIHNVIYQTHEPSYISYFSTIKFYLSSTFV